MFADRNITPGSQEEFMNEKKPMNKGLQITILIFALIGVLAVLTLCVIGVLAIRNHFAGGKDEVQKIKVEESTADIDAEAGEEGMKPEEISEDTNTDAEANADKNTDGNEPDPFENVLVPDTEAAETADEFINEDGELTITFFGDSILDHYRDETGVAGKLSAMLDATVEYRAIGGTCAAAERDAKFENERWDCTCGLGMVKALVGDISIDVLRDCAATQIMREHMDEIKQSDIFIIEYGINDFLSGKPMASEDLIHDPLYSYVGAMKEMVRILQSNFPNARIIICQPSYVYFYKDNGEFIGDSYTLNNGPGSEYDYGGKAEYVANEYGAVFYSMDKQGIDSYNSDEMLIDGIHLSERGRALYAENLKNLIWEEILGTNE